MAKEDIDELIATARRARLAGDYAEAELACRQALDLGPVNPVASGLLGQCLAEQGDVTAAAELIGLALSLAPNDADVRLNAAALRDREGDQKGAIDEARRAAELAPGKFEALATLGNLLGAAGDFAGARDALDRAVAINPRHAGAALLLAAAAAETGDHAGVRRALDLADAAAPGLAQSYRLRAGLARRRQDWSELTRVAKDWLVRHPGDPDARIALAHGLGQLGFYETASAAYEPVALENPQSADHAAAMGRYRLGARKMDEARQWFDRAIALDPGCAEAHFGLARQLTYLGRLDEAVAACRRAIAADPAHVDAYAQLADATEGDLADAELEALERLARDDALAPERRSAAWFGIGEARRRRGDHKAAFAAWTAANEIKREMALASPRGAYDRAGQEAFVSKLIGLFPRDPAGARPAPAGRARPRPIFIVGMPRSGTTLLESAISAHPDVEGGGELPGVPFFLEEFVEWAAREKFAGGEIPEAERRRWRERYFAQIEEFGAGGGRFVTDKQPVNFMAIGFIRAVFPEAAIIHIRRDPVETGLSIYRRNFSHRWPYANDLAAIGHYYGQYARVMTHWARAYRGAFLDILYERLVSDFEAELRRALDYCDLAWDPACLSFHEAERPVVTFSAAQVRQPVTTGRMKNAAPYEAELAPLRRALAEAGLDPATGVAAPRPAPKR